MCSCSNLLVGGNTDVNIIGWPMALERIEVLGTGLYQLLVAFHDDPDLGIDALVYEL